MSELLQRVRDFLLGDPVRTDDPNTVTDWVRLGEWSQWQQVLVLCLAGVVLLVTAWNLRRLPRTWPRIVLFSLRLATLAVLLFAFYQPALLEERRARSTNTVVLLADDSASMALPHGDSTRRDREAAFVTEQADTWKELERTNAVETYRFADGLEPADWRTLDKTLTARGTHSRLIETLEELRDRYRNRDIGGILLLSDGIDNGRAGRILGQGNALDQETVSLLASLDAPIYTFGVDEDDIKDVSVGELRYSPFAFKRNLSSIEAVLQVHGYDSGTLEVELLEEGKLVRSVTREIAKGVSTYTATFDFTPEELGQRVYAVRVKPFTGEVTTENNERYAVIRVNRDKIRVLQIAGHPSWDERFLRNHLKSTPKFQLISFFILINPSGALNLQAHETALIPFPAEELFVGELGGFDLVVLQDFNYGPFSTPQHLHRIRDYVKDGGALAMIGGRLAFGAGGYVDTEISEILPVEMTAPDFQDDALDTTEFRPQLTEAGRTHTITQLSFDESENRKIWETLPKLEGVNKMRGLKNGGIALARHPDLRGDDGQGMPVIAVGEPGKGRVAVVTTDSLWRWKLPNAGAGGDEQAYDRFWQNLIRWLIKDPDLDLVRVTPSAGVRPLGESVDLEVRVFEPDYRPSQAHPFSLVVTRRPRVGHEEAPTIVLERNDARTDDNGRFELTQTPTEPGIYDVQARTSIAGRQLTARSVFVVSDERPEMREVLSDKRLLEAISRVTGGASFSLDARNLPLKFNPPRVSDVTSRRYHERWNVPAVFLGCCLLFGLEWWLRRRWGYL